MVELNPIAGGYDHLTKPVVNVWKGLLQRARHAKEGFNVRARQVMDFYSGGNGSMWLPAYMNEFMGGPKALAQPKFKITSNVLFEMVQIFRPLIFWEMPDYSVKPQHSVNIDPMALAGDDPEAQQFYGQKAQEAATLDQRNSIRSMLLERILNYFQREQPNTLTAHANLALFDMLTKGAGFLKTEEYRFPMSDRTLVGSFYENVDNVLVDPDCTDPLWSNARWIAIRHRTAVDETETHFGLDRGSLRPYAEISSNSASYQKGLVRDDRVAISKDVIEWYEIFSRAGFGQSLVGSIQNPPIPPEFDRARGSVMVDGMQMPDKYPYLCICTACPYPLNLCSRDFAMNHATDEWIKAQTDWPTEYWRDNKWPIEMLWLYEFSGNSPWPMSGASPAIGEMTALNILMSSWVEQCWKGRQQVVGYRKGAVENIDALLQSDESVLGLPINPDFRETLKDVLEFMKRPEVNGDLIQSIEFVTNMIKKRLGLLDELYGGSSGAEPRSAAAYEGKMSTVNIRPEYMQKQFAAFQSRVADKAVFCSYIHVSADDIAEQLGPLGVPAWEMLVTNEGPEAILRGSKSTVEASGIRRPNKAKDMQDLQGMQQFWLPIMAGAMAQNGDVRQMNGFLKALGSAAEINVEEFLFPEPAPEQAQHQQAMQQAELEQTQAETQKLLADAHKSVTEAEGGGQAAQQDAALKQQTAEHGMAIKQQTAEHAASLKERQMQLAAMQKQHDMATKQDSHEQQLSQRHAEARQKLGLDFMNAIQGIQQKAATHVQQTGILDDKAQSDAKRGNLITLQKMLQSAAQHQQQLTQAPNERSSIVKQFELTNIDGYEVTNPIKVMSTTGQLDKDGKTVPTIKMEAITSGGKSIVTEVPEYMGEAHCLNRLRMDIRNAASNHCDSNDAEVKKHTAELSEDLKANLVRKDFGVGATGPGKTEPHPQGHPQQKGPDAGPTHQSSTPMGTPQTLPPQNVPPGQSRFQ